MKCDQCVAAMINRVFCHEVGCPNTNKRYDGGDWIAQRDCRECGSTVDADSLCSCEEEESEGYPDGGKYF